MPTHTFHRTRKGPAAWLPLTVLAINLCLLPVSAGQAPPNSSAPSRQAVPEAGQGSEGEVTPKKSSMTFPGKRPATSRSNGLQFSQGGRDPFKVPEPPSGKGSGNGMNSAGGSLPPGARGLLISQLKLEGVVREHSANKMIAVVTNDTRRAYFLTENESVYDGVVSKITPDAVYFTENVLDTKGRVTTREVVKRLGPAPGEGR
jgi:hypothetical protein